MSRNRLDKSVSKMNATVSLDWLPLATSGYHLSGLLKSRVENRFQLESIDWGCLGHYFEKYLGATSKIREEDCSDWLAMSALGRRGKIDGTCTKSLPKATSLLFSKGKEIYTANWMHCLSRENPHTNFKTSQKAKTKIHKIIWHLFWGGEYIRRNNLCGCKLWSSFVSLSEASWIC